jgi:hypothetical protein
MENLLRAETIENMILNHIQKESKPAFLKGSFGKPVKIRILNGISDHRVVEDFSISYRTSKNSHGQSFINEPVFNFSVEEVFVDNKPYIAFNRNHKDSNTDLLIPAEDLVIESKGHWLKKKYLIVLIPSKTPLYKKTGKGRYEENSRSSESNTETV